MITIHTQEEQLDNRLMWGLIGIFLSVIVIVTLIGWIDWTPRQSNVPETTPVNTNDAVESGGLELHTR